MTSSLVAVYLNNQRSFFSVLLTDFPTAIEKEGGFDLDWKTF